MRFAGDRADEQVKDPQRRRGDDEADRRRDGDGAEGRRGSWRERMASRDVKGDTARRLMANSSGGQRSEGGIGDRLRQGVQSFAERMGERSAASSSAPAPSSAPSGADRLRQGMQSFAERMGERSSAPSSSPAPQRMEQRPGMGSGAGAPVSQPRTPGMGSAASSASTAPARGQGVQERIERFRDDHANLRSKGYSEQAAQQTATQAFNGGQRPQPSRRYQMLSGEG